MQVRSSFLYAIPAGLLLVLAAWCGLIYFQLGVPTENERYFHELLQKKERAALAVNEPKLLLVAGSSALFGLNAQLIRDQTGIPTVNFGTHLPLGTRYILHLTQLMARPGDTVLLAFEYEAYDYGPIDGHWRSGALIGYLVACDPRYLLSLPLAERYAVVMSMPLERFWYGLFHSIIRAKRVEKNPTYNSEEAVDAIGDEIANSRARRPPDPPAFAYLSEPLVYGMPEEPAGFPPIEAFCRWACQHHVRVLATFPNILRRSEYDSPQTRETLGRIRGFFRSIEVPLLGNAEDLMLPRDQFFDTPYHLTKEAARARTERLVKELAPYLDVIKAGH